MQKYLLEWSALDVVKPALTADVGGPHKVNDQPALTECRGFLHVMAKSPKEAVNHFKRNYRNRHAIVKISEVQ